MINKCVLFRELREWCLLGTFYGWTHYRWSCWRMLWTTGVKASLKLCSLDMRCVCVCEWDKRAWQEIASKNEWPLFNFIYFILFLKGYFGAVGALLELNSSWSLLSHQSLPKFLVNLLFHQTPLLCGSYSMRISDDTCIINDIRSFV